MVGWWVWGGTWRAVLRCVCEWDPKIKKDKNIITANAINYSFLNKKLSCEPNAKMIISSDNDYWENLKKELIEF
jgi:hypothetical protein